MSKEIFTVRLDSSFEGESTKLQSYEIAAADATSAAVTALLKYLEGYVRDFGVDFVGLDFVVDAPQYAHFTFRVEGDFSPNRVDAVAAFLKYVD